MDANRTNRVRWQAPGAHRAVPAVLALLAFAASCSETNLYSPSLARKEANRVAVTGRVCTEDPVEARFPVRVVLLVDRAAGPLFADFDSAGARIGVLRDFVQAALDGPQTELAIVGYAGRVRKLAPVEGDFTRNPGELFAAVNQLALPEPCLDDDQCRNYREGFRSARALIEGDLAKQPAGLRVLTQYVVVMVNAGPQSPMALSTECCAPDDVQCLDNPVASPACESMLGVDAIKALERAVSDAGAAGLRVHAIQLAANHDASPDVAAAINQELEDAMQNIAFAGSGVYQRVDAMGGFTASTLAVLDMRTVLTAKLLFAANLNAKPGPHGHELDSDADGLSDEEEARLGTSPGARDTDGDGITDLVEVLAGFDPLVLDLPAACENVQLNRDQDVDGLTDCDERLLGTEPTLVDSDGDGMPDMLEVIAGIDYVDRDAEGDADGDGVSNGDEVVQHSDPRSTDTRAHLSHGYRYELFDEGFVRDLFGSSPIRLTGVELLELSPGTTPGLGALHYIPEQNTLRWKDAGDEGPGPAVPIGEGGELELPSSSYAPVQGSDGRIIKVFVDPVELPPAAVSETIRVIYRDRQCIQYTIRNLQLVPSIELDDGTPAGMNSILVYFAEAPAGRLASPGPFRMAQIPVIFNPPAVREPDDAVLLIDNQEFIRPKLSP